MSQHQKVFVFISKSMITTLKIFVQISNFIYSKFKTYLSEFENDISSILNMFVLEDHRESAALEVQNAINFEILSTFEKPFERQVAEAVAIQNCKADLVLNSKAE